jgi:hypothetical protein
MTWLAWRLLRTQAAVVYAAVALLAALLAATGPAWPGSITPAAAGSCTASTAWTPPCTWRAR